jgi:hypothetical protein
MMDFLRALAPSRAAARTRALPVVPSRFESERPMAHVMTTAAIDPSALDPADGVRDVARLPKSTREHGVERASLTDEAPVAAESDERFATSSRAEQAPTRSTSRPLQVRAEVNTRDTAERAGQVRPMPPASHAVAGRAAQTVTTSQRVPAVTIGRRVSNTEGPPNGDGPLSSGAVAARVVPPAEIRPVIHVTIDRIDVRAPSGPERASSRPRPRAHSSGSLTDYLRSRQTGRPGGSS